MRKSVFSPEGRASLDRVVASRRPLLAFDFDGTLAPIVPRPDEARLPLPVARRLAQLSSRFAVAIVTGRAIVDVKQRLTFEPCHLVGSHGAEDPAADDGTGAWSTSLDPARAVLRAAQVQLEACGVVVEDKGLSIALHYRCASDEAVARAAITAVLRGIDQGLNIGRGKCVVNLTPLGAPDKGDALRALAERIGAGAGLYIGDDENDEPAFTKLGVEWTTVRVGPTAGDTRANYFMDGPSQMPVLLQYLIDASLDPRLHVAES